jgi:hypothetical protein
MPTSSPATVMGSFDLVEAFAPENRQKRSLRTNLFDRSISDWKRLDIRLAIRESKMEVFGKLFIAADAAPTPPRAVASRMPLHQENQLASRFQHFWIE